MIPKLFLPEVYRTGEFLLTPLTVDNLIKDYDAVMASVNHLIKT